MRRVVVLSVMFLVMGCGNFRRHWPAVIRSIENFESAEKALVMDALEKLNTEGKRFIVADDPLIGYPILIRKVAHSKENPKRVGYAIVGPTSCIIELSEKLFDELDSIFLTVVYHEMGHCAGLMHTKNPHEIMSESATPFDDFTGEELGNFFDSFFKAIGI